MKKFLDKSAQEINKKMESNRLHMRKVYKIIFNLEEVSKEKMKNPSPKEKKILAKHEDLFTKSIYDDFSEICSFYNTIQLFWNISKEYQNVKPVIKILKDKLMLQLFSTSLTDIWIIGAEIFSIINDLFPSCLKKRYLILRNLLPLLDSFFMAHTIISIGSDLQFDEEEEEEEESESDDSSCELK